MALVKTKEQSLTQPLFKKINMKLRLKFEKLQFAGSAI